jgi:hypothetical protein
MVRGLIVAAGAAAALSSTPPAFGAGWLPHPSDATWTYQWVDSIHSPTPTKEKVTVREQRGTTFILDWTTNELGNPTGAVSGAGLMYFQDTTAGLVEPDPGWQSTAPPPSFPVLCAQPTRCGNSLASTLYQLVWGTRAPVLAEPVVAGATWTSRGGAEGEVMSFSQYRGRETITVPAFTVPVVAAKVRTDITHTGALGDPYGSGVRTVWWVYGVGPVRIVFEHSGGAEAPVTTAELVSTNQSARMPPSDENYFPLNVGTKRRYRWTNSKHLRQPSIQELSIAESINNSARFDVKHIRGPIRVAGTYGFSLRTDGLTNIFAATRVASLAKFPPLGPRFVPQNRRRRFFTPFDLMTYGLNPVLQAHPAAGQAWSAKAPSRDFSTFGVTGGTRVLGMRTVRVPAGTFSALAVRSTLRQAKFPFGSGTRTSYFVAGKGLVKLVFRHADGSTSTVELLR